MNGRAKIFVTLPKWLRKRWWEVAYLAPPDWGVLRERFSNLTEVEPDEKFNQLISKSIEALVEKGELPPAAIAPTIMNMADDLAHGRQMTIRAGDYIALQGHLRKTQPFGG